MKRVALNRLGVALSCALSLCALTPACALFRGDLPGESPPLADLSPDLDLVAEPDDEAARQALPKGSFTGVEVERAAASLDELTGDDEGVLSVLRVVENSPADFAGVAPGDLVLAVTIGGTEHAPRWPGAWRALELETAPGAHWTLELERAGRALHVELDTQARASAAPRLPVEILHEDQRVGIYVRTPSEVEARAAGIGPGSGALVVALAKSSPWRAGSGGEGGVRHGDVVIAVDGVEVGHPAALLDAIRRADPDVEMELRVWRAGAEPPQRTIRVKVSERAGELRAIDVPLIFSYESEDNRTSWSAILALLHWESTPAAWRFRFLWIFDVSGGDADRLIEEPGS